MKLVIISPSSKIAYGYCHCGCGNKTTIPYYNSKSAGEIGGIPKKFLPGHNHKNKLGKEYKKKHKGYKINGRRSVCWIWQGAKDKNGYGKCKRPSHLGECVPHRWMYKKHYGIDSIPKGYELHHRCEVRSCIRPEHLQPIAKKEHSTLQKVGKRAFSQLANRLLTNAQVRQIRNSNLSIDKLAVMLGSNRTTIYRIRKGIIYKEVV